MPTYVIPFADNPTKASRLDEINAAGIAAGFIDGEYNPADDTDYLPVLEGYTAEQLAILFTDAELASKLPLTVGITFDDPGDYKIFLNDRIILSAKNDAGLRMMYEVESSSTATASLNENILKPTSVGTLVIRAKLNDETQVHVSDKPHADITISVTEASKFEKASKYVKMTQDLGHDLPILIGIFSKFTNDDIHNFQINYIDQDTFNVKLHNGDKEADENLKDDYVARRLVSAISREVRALYEERAIDMVEIGNNL